MMLGLGLGFWLVPLGFLFVHLLFFRVSSIGLLSHYKKNKQKKTNTSQRSFFLPDKDHQQAPAFLLSITSNWIKRYLMRLHIGSPEMSVSKCRSAVPCLIVHSQAEADAEKGPSASEHTAWFQSPII